MHTEQSEAEKYRRMWTHDRYRKNAPGERLVDDAVKRLKMKPGQSVIDFGCGTGRAAAKFQALGMEVSAIDIAENCLDEGVEIPLAIQPLWEMSPFVARYGFCTDVMEHVPEDRVDDVLLNIALATDACYFQIATRPDGMGKLIGETLHLTVENANWWRQKLEEHFDVVELDQGNGGVIAVCRSS